MNPTGTHIAYLHTCHLKLWLFVHGIQIEHTSDIVAEGKLISESTYLDRTRKYMKLAIDGVKIDFYDAKNKVIHEVKKSDKVEHAHIAQVKYYMYVLQKNGIDGVTAILEYPKMRQREIVEWELGDVQAVEEWIAQVRQIISQSSCPELIKKPICKKCSYYELCYVGEG